MPEPEPEVLVELERDGSAIVITSWSPALTPLMICVRESPRSPTTTCWVTSLPFFISVTVPSGKSSLISALVKLYRARELLPVTAAFGTVTPDAWPVITVADALMPGLTRESF